MFTPTFPGTGSVRLGPVKPQTNECLGFSLQYLGLARTAEVKRQFLQHVFQQLEDSLPQEVQPDGRSDQGLGEPNWKRVCASLPPCVLPRVFPITPHMFCHHSISSFRFGSKSKVTLTAYFAFSSVCGDW